MASKDDVKALRKRTGSGIMDVSSALKEAESRLDVLAGQTKGGPQQRLLLERQRIRRLLEDLDAGRPVDPQDIDRALNNAERPF